MPTVWRPGTLVRPRELTSVNGDPIPVPDPHRLIHLQFRRFAGCPICNLHLRSIVRRHNEIRAAGVTEVVVFHSTAADLREYGPDLPFAVVGDPDKRLYAEFGVEASARALLNPGTWWAITYGSARDVLDILRGRRPRPQARPNGGRLGLPADLLIRPDGGVVAHKYGEHADDQWSVDELLMRVRAHDAVRR
jgi:hypothetical protein